MAAQKITEEPPELHNYKTWVFRASIHCEGCKRKVKKILSQVQGVYGVDIDIKQQKVTVTGNVEADTLLKKLQKSGKNAELWPQQAIQNEKKTENLSKNKEKQAADDHHQPKAKANGDNNKDITKPPVIKIHEAEAAAVQDPLKKKINDTKRDHEVQENEAIGKNGGASDTAKVVEGVADVREVKLEGKKPETGAVGGLPPVEAEKKGGEVDTNVGGEKSVSGKDDGKKMKKKGQNRNYVEGETSNVRPTSIGTQHPGPPHGSIPANDGLPRHQSYDQYPPPHGPRYDAPPPPIYGVSYNTTYPTTNYTAAYYAQPPPNSYAYSAYPSSGAQPQPQPHPQPQPDVYSYENQPLDSFEMFSDENPNGCSVM